MQSFSFGLLADPQYGQIPPRGSRSYSNSLEKMRQCAEVFQKAAVSFAVCLGDLVEGGPNAAHECEAATAALRQSGLPCHFVPGNHDVNSLDRDFLARLWGHPDSRGFYAFSYGGVLFLVLDTNGGADGLPCGVGQCDWKNCFLPTEQLAWLDTTLQNAPERRAVVFSHALLDDFAGENDPHGVRNAEAVRAVLEKSGKVEAVFQGHMHCGRQSVSGGIPYITLPGLVEATDGIAALVVSVSADGLSMTRY